MADFYIRQLIVSGDHVKSTVLDFKPGANIIFGKSDIGKSYVVECLNFLFGSKNMRLKYNSGYNTVTAVIQTSRGEIRLERRFDVNKQSVSVFSTDPRYEHLSCTGQSKDVLDSLWLRLIGVRENQTVVASGDYDHELLKWSLFRRMLLIKENEISGNGSVIPGSVKALSSLLFLLTNMDFADVPSRESDADRRKRLKGVREHILKQMKEIAARRQVLLEEMNSAPVITSKQEWSALLSRFSLQEQRMNSRIEESHQLHAQLDEAQKQLLAYKLQRENFLLLRSMYDARMKQMSFTMEGLLLSAHVKDCKCPVCGEITKGGQIDSRMIVAAKAEMEKMERTILHFQEAREDLDRKMKMQEDLLARLKDNCSSIDAEIAEAYAPDVEEMKSRLDQYEENIRRQNTFDLLGVDYATLDNELSTLEIRADDGALKFQPKQEFPPEFFRGMAEKLKALLLACGFTHQGDMIDFDSSTMDVSINYQDKSTFGEGYRAFLNTAVAFSLFRYLCENGAHAPGILIIDSPIQAMREPDGSDLIKSLFNYIYEYSKCGQVIIVDNRIPDDSNEESANIIVLHESGFLPDFIHPTKRRKKKNPITSVPEEQISFKDL